MTIANIKTALRRTASKEQARVLQGFFKTGPGEYGEGDIFIGVKVPAIRTVVKEHKDLALKDTLTILRSPIHEERLLALLILVLKYAKESVATQEKIYKTYLKNTRYINNWDLIDLTAHHIVGAYLSDKDKKPLYKLARSKDLWEKRISILATFHYIRNGKFSDSLKVSKILLKDDHDLIHKAVGWMLREIGKRDMQAEENFLKKHYKTMPRTMLRYAIERFPEKKSLSYLHGKI
ncbi:MAG: DNA alkylation repair protein [Candidatus Tantalella remota]|nr:DNA alkylation repair protein [Candidatus Tantalella remota]